VLNVTLVNSAVQKFSSSSHFLCARRDCLKISAIAVRTPAWNGTRYVREDPFSQGYPIIPDPGERASNDLLDQISDLARNNPDSPAIYRPMTRQNQFWSTS
jgi:hypothetical protein